MQAQVRLWDVSAGEQVTRLTGHTDYVRAAAASPSSSDSWATGVPTWVEVSQTSLAPVLWLVWITGMTHCDALGTVNIIFYEIHLRAAFATWDRCHL